MSDLVVRSFDYTTKIVSDTDCSINKFVPLIQLRLHCEDRQHSTTVRIHEFTLPEARQFLHGLLVPTDGDDKQQQQKAQQQD